jgi:methionyl-tRNA formyltransferase/ubiquinone/menaquinone biosynthesis C-methylase UbiE
MRFRITILSDSDSWINDYIPELTKELEKHNHSVNILHKAEDISPGDFVFFLGCSQIVANSILKRNRHNVLVHESNLPHGKGWSPLTWQVLEGKNEIPVCLLEVAEHVDSGKIYLRDTMKFNGTELVSELRKTQADTSIRMCLRFVSEYPDIVEKGVNQEGESTFYKRRSKEDSRLNPDKTIREQFNLLRVVDNGSYPAFFDLAGETYLLKIERKNRFNMFFKESKDMKRNTESDTQLMQRATSTNNLKERSDVNQSYGVNNFDEWVDSLLDKIQFASVLDICSGTGNQLLKYAKKNNNASLMGVDISRESLQTADERLKSIGAKRYTLKAIAMEDLFEDAELNSRTFDLISCFYGLYYSRDTAKTLEQMMAHLTANGTMLIVGPYGNNNDSLFDIIERHFALPELVKRSASTFMEYEVVPLLSKHLKVNTETFVNPVRYPNPKVLMDYWRASTFFSPEHENAVLRDIEEHFAMHGHFIMEKHIMACIASRS